MKIRLGFVSNSSSSSFCIYGCYCQDINEEEVTKKVFDLRKLTNDDRFSTWVTPSDQCYIGIQLPDMKDDETFGEFKSKIDKVLRDQIGSKCTIIEESWYDG